MSTVVRTRTIDAGIDAVWAALADFGAISRWAPDVDHSSLLRAPAAGIGGVRRVQLGRTTLLERVVAWDEPTRLAYRIEGLPPVVRRAENEWCLAPEGGATSVVLTSRVDVGPRPPQRLIAWLVGRRLGAASDRMLDGLAAHLLAARTLGADTVEPPAAAATESEATP